MRPVYPYDLQDAARVLMRAAPEDRVELARAIIARAQVADRYRKRLGRAHDTYGNGTLSAAARSFPQAPMPWRSSRAFLDAMRVFLTVWMDQDSDQSG